MGSATGGFTIRSAKRPALKAGAFSEPIAGGQGPSSASYVDKRNRKKKMDRERPDFYKFQQREKRREEIMDHRRRKAEDEEKVEHMRKTKRFKAARATP